MSSFKPQTVFSLPSLVALVLGLYGQYISALWPQMYWHFLVVGRLFAGKLQIAAAGYIVFDIQSMNLSHRLSFFSILA